MDEKDADVTIRPRYANWQGADAFLSLHTNASGKVDSSGNALPNQANGTPFDHLQRHHHRRLRHLARQAARAYFRSHTRQA